MHHIKHKHDFGLDDGFVDDNKNPQLECKICCIQATVRYVSLTGGRIPSGYNTTEEEDAESSCEEIKLRNLLK